MDYMKWILYLIYYASLIGFFIIIMKRIIWLEKSILDAFNFIKLNTDDLDKIYKYLGLIPARKVQAKNDEDVKK